MLLKVRAEKEEATKLRSDPNEVNPDQDSLQRLKSMQQEQQAKKSTAVPASALGPVASSLGFGKPAEQVQGRRESANREASPAEDEPGAGPRPGSASVERTEDAEMGLVEGADPCQGMSAKQRKLLELRQRLQQCRKQNHNAVIAEKKRQKVRRDSQQ